MPILIKFVTNPAHVALGRDWHSKKRNSKCVFISMFGLAMRRSGELTSRSMSPDVPAGLTPKASRRSGIARVSK